MEDKKFRSSIFIVSIVILLIILLLAASDMGPFADHARSTLAVDKIDSNLIVLWGQEGRKIDTKALAQDLKDNGIPGGGNAQIVSIAFYRSDGNVFVADLEGKEILPCAAVVDGQIFPVRISEGKIEPTEKGEICPNLKDTNIVGLSKSVTILTEKSPECPIRSYGGYLMQRCP